MNKQDVLCRFSLRQLEDTTLKISHITLKKSAVLIPLVMRRGVVHIILTKRSDHLRHHPGQISFPGGKFDHTDDSLKMTALRETHEELGIDNTDIDLFGELPHHDTITGFTIKPYLGFVNEHTKIVANENEVSEIIEIPLSQFINNQHHFTLAIERPRVNVNVYFKPANGYAIWGATAAIIEQFGRALRD